MSCSDIQKTGGKRLKSVRQDEEVVLPRKKSLLERKPSGATLDTWEGTSAKAEGYG